MPGAPHMTVRVNGVGGQEFDIFSFGFSIGRGDFLTAPQMASIRDAVQTYFTADGTAICAMGSLREVAFALVDATGKQSGDTVRLPAVGQGSYNGTVHPAQISARVSLGDGLRGRSHRGGWYLPYVGWTVDFNSGTSTVAKAAAMRDTTLTFIRAVNTAAGAPGAVVIASKVAGNLPVTTVRVGNVLDTIRSRRNNIEEAYQVGTV